MTLSKPVLIGSGVALAALAVFWLTQKGNAGSVGAAVGGAAVDLVTGVVSGAASAAADTAKAVGVAVVDTANNPGINPLEPVGAWLGSTAYDWTH